MPTCPALGSQNPVSMVWHHSRDFSVTALKTKSFGDRANNLAYDTFQLLGQFFFVGGQIKHRAFEGRSFVHLRLQVFSNFVKFSKHSFDTISDLTSMQTPKIFTSFRQRCKQSVYVTQGYDACMMSRCKTSDVALPRHCRANCVIYLWIYCLLPFNAVLGLQENDPKIIDTLWKQLFHTGRCFFSSHIMCLKYAAKKRQKIRFKAHKSAGNSDLFGHARKAHRTIIM